MGPIVDVICHPLFCLRFWPEPKDDELMGLNILLTAAGIGPRNKNKQNKKKKKYDIAFRSRKSMLVTAAEQLACGGVEPCNQGRRFV